MCSTIGDVALNNVFSAEKQIVSVILCSVQLRVLCLSPASRISVRSLFLNFDHFSTSRRSYKKCSYKKSLFHKCEPVCSLQ